MSIFDIFKSLESSKKNNMRGISDEKSVNSGAIQYIICGLGNPGLRYENTRHNAGFMTINRLAEKLCIEVKKLKFKSLTAEATIKDIKCFLMKPTTFMNKSGEALREAMAFYKIPPERVIIIFDDISQDVGVIRIRKNGSDGGHNGMKNIIYLSGFNTFPRIKIGIGGKPHPDYDLADWVTSPFKKEEGSMLELALDKAISAIEYMVCDEFDTAMNKFNGKSIKK